jgi:diacylglycerol kinase family enzyme
MASVALLSNPRSTGNRSELPRVRRFCAAHADIFHYEVEHADQIGQALRTIARVRPRVLVINGGDGTVQATLTEIYHGGHFGENPPPVAVLPNGKTNLIAHDLGASGDPIEALERILDLARTDIVPHIVSRELISLTGGAADGRPELGMFLGGAGLADTILYCRHKIYPLGLPNWAAHTLTLLLGLVSVLVGRSSRLLPAKWGPLRVSVTRSGEMQGRFALIMVTTLERLLLNGSMTGAGPHPGAMQLLVIERNLFSILGALIAALRGRLGRHRIHGVHLERGDEIRIHGSHSSVILDGEMFEANDDRPIVLRPTAAMPFLRLAA